MTDARPYGFIVGRNISAARGRLQLSQSAVALRMQTLGFPWQQQTAAASEKNRRRVTAEEIFALAIALETTISSLMGANGHDEDVQLPGGQVFGAVTVERSAGRGINDRTASWADSNKSVSYIVTRRLPGIDAFDPATLARPHFTEEPPDGDA